MWEGCQPWDSQRQVPAPSPPLPPPHLTQSVGHVGLRVSVCDLDVVTRDMSQDTDFIHLLIDLLGENTTSPSLPAHNPLPACDAGGALMLPLLPSLPGSLLLTPRPGTHLAQMSVSALSACSALGS